MTQLELGDKFIIDRSGSTYRTTFEEIENSINHQYTITLDQTEGGGITSSTVENGGDDFLSNTSYEFNSSSSSFTVLVNEDGVLDDDSYTISNNSVGITVGEEFVGYPYDNDGAVLTLTNSVGWPTDLELDVSFDYTLDQDSIDGLGVTDNVYPGGAAVRVTGTGVGLEPTVKIIARGNSYYAGEATVLRSGNTDYKVNITSTDSNTVIPSATIKVTEVSDGTDQDKAQFTVKIGSNDRTVKVTPGRGIAFETVYDDDGNILDDEIIINNTLEAGGGGEGGSTNSEPPVYVTPTPPTPPTYDVRNGALWYNLMDGRTYIAITYPSSNGSSRGGFSYDWIDASPSSLNDAVRKTGDTMTGALYIDNASLYTPHYQLELLPLIQNAPTT